MSFHDQLTAQHRACDAAFAEIEEHGQRADWSAVQRAFTEFLRQTEQHFAYEEDVLFPALEAAQPMAAQPVAVMRSEHAQIRELAADLQLAIDEQRPELLSGSLETLMFMLQQHNSKEESVLYPLADRTLSTDLLKQTAPTAGSTR